jgi:hypothetical protein
MSSDRGRLETQITVPAGGWSVSLTVTAIGGPVTVTVAAGSYYPLALLSTFKTQLDAAFGGDGVFTVSGSWGESGTGFVTISHTVETFSFTWTSTDFRDCLGFTTNLTPAATSFVGTRSAQGVWLPGAVLAHERGSTDTGHYEVVMPQTVSPLGVVKTLAGSVRVRLPPITWSHVLRASALRAADSSGVTMSLERWWFQSQAGGLSYFRAGAPVNVYTNADTPTLLGDYKLIWDGKPVLRRVDPAWDGIWTVVIEGYEVP